MRSRAFFRIGIKIAWRRLTSYELLNVSARSGENNGMNPERLECNIHCEATIHGANLSSMIFCVIRPFST